MKKIKRKKYAKGGALKDIGAGLYGLGEGVLDNVTFGATDGLTDMGYNALSGGGDQKSNKIRAGANVIGQIGGAVATGGATTASAVKGGLKSANTFVQNTNMDEGTKKMLGIGTQIAGMIPIGGANYGGTTEQMQMGQMITSMKYGGKMQLGGYLSSILDAPQKSMMKLVAGKYQKPSDYMYENGLKEKYPKRHSEIALAADLLADPLNLVPVGGEANAAFKVAKNANKIGKIVKGINTAGDVDELANYVNKKTSNVGVRGKYADGGSMKDVILDGKLVRKWVASDGKLYDQNPDAGHGYEFSGDEPKKEFSPEFVNDWNNAARDVQAMQSDKQYTYNGVIYKKLDNGKYAWYSKSQGMWKEAKNFDDDFVKRNGLDNSKPIKKSNTTQDYDNEEEFRNRENEDYNPNKKPNLIKTDATHAYFDDGSVRFLKGAKSGLNRTGDGITEKEMNEFKKNPNYLRMINGDTPITFATRRSKKQMGGQMTNQLAPQNPDDIEDETENTIEYQGNPHTQGGIPLQNGAELEKNETVVKSNAVGNKEPYAISPNLILDRNTAKLVGLPSRYAGYKLSDISRLIEDSKPKESYGSKATNDINKKFALKKLIKANELLSAQHRQENGEPTETSNLRQEEMQLGGTLPKLDTSGFEDIGNYGADFESNYKDGLIDEYGNPIYKDNIQVIDGGKANNRYIEPKFPNLSSRPYSTDIPQQPYGETPTIPGASKGFNFKMPTEGQIGMGIKVASLLGEAALIGKKPKTIPTQYNMRGQEALNEMNGRKIDIQPILNGINGQMAAARVYNNDRSFNVQRGLNNNVLATGLQKLQEAQLQGQEINNKYKGEYANLLNNVGQQDAAARTYAEQINTQTQDNWKNRKGEFIQNVGNGVGDMLLKKDAINKFNAEHFQLLKESAGDYGISVDNTADYMKLINDPQGEGQLIAGKMANKEALSEKDKATLLRLGFGTDNKSIYSPSQAKSNFTWSPMTTNWSPTMKYTK